MDLLERILEIRQRGERAVLVTLIETRGSTPRKPGARMLLLDNGRQEGTIGGGKVEHVLRETATRVLRTGQPEVITYHLTADLEMCCGGEMRFFLEPIATRPTLIVFGCGHVGKAVIEVAAPLGFEIVAVDDLQQNAHPDRLPQAGRCINSYDPDELTDLPFGGDTYVVIATREHAHDQRLLELCLSHETRYVGTIGSPRKAGKQRDTLASKGYSEDAIARVRCPIGLDIGAETPEEIAVSICAEIVHVMRGGPRFAAK